MKNKSKKILIYVVVSFFILFIFNFYLNLTLPIKTSGLTDTINIPSSNKPIAWPSFGQSAVGIVDGNYIISHNQQVPSPIASTAKLITILSVLSVHPLSLNNPGPNITLTSQDISIYNTYVKEGGSVVPVVLGEKLTEYQMLQAMLLPSANNIADSLAIWAFGSLSNYSNYANNFLKQKSIFQTHVGIDASGYDPSTVSTASDLVKIGELAIQNPVIAQIVDSKLVTNFPVINSFNNLDFLIGQNNIIGIKTGNTDQAGGVFISASIKDVNNHKVTIVTAVLKAPNLKQALISSDQLISSVQNSFTQQVLISNNKIITSIKLPWGKTVNVHLKGDLTAYSWINDYETIFINYNSIKVNTTTNDVIGHVSIKKNLFNNFSTQNIYLSSSIKPPISWLLFHINY